MNIRSECGPTVDDSTRIQARSYWHLVLACWRVRWNCIPVEDIVPSWPGCIHRRLDRGFPRNLSMDRCGEESLENTERYCDLWTVAQPEVQPSGMCDATYKEGHTNPACGLTYRRWQKFWHVVPVTEGAKIISEMKNIRKSWLFQLNINSDILYASANLTKNSDWLRTAKH